MPELGLAYEQWGTGDPPLLLLHGFTGGKLDWTDVIGPLCGDRRVVAYDQRGHGDSPRAADASGYTFDHLVDDLAAVVDEHALAPFDLLGHSMGGIVAMRYAMTHTDKLRSLILMDTAAEPAGRIPREWVDSVVGLARDKGMAAVGDLFASFTAQQSPAPRPEVLDRGRYKLEHMDPVAFEAFANELNAYPSILDDLAKLDLPVTVIVGANDTGLRAGADALAETIPGAELVVIPGAGHSPQEDDPDAWVAAVRSHLDRAARR
jgi:pimeloyl-ACP methyl ester carboxylesterase